MRTCHYLLALGLAFAVHGFARAEYVTATLPLDQSNTLADGLNYGKVTIEAYDGIKDGGGGLAAGSVRIVFDITALPEYGTLGNFGMDMVGFTTDLAIKASQIQAPTDWKLSDNVQMNGFGIFSWHAAKQKGPTRLDPVELLITGLGTDATLDHFLIESKQKNGKEPPQGGTAFAAHVAGFSGVEANDFTGSHYVGDTVPTLHDSPEPTSLALFGVGMAGIGMARVWRRRKEKIVA